MRSMEERSGYELCYLCFFIDYNRPTCNKFWMSIYLAKRTAGRVRAISLLLSFVLLLGLISASSLNASAHQIDGVAAYKSILCAPTARVDDANIPGDPSKNFCKKHLECCSSVQHLLNINLNDGAFLYSLVSKSNTKIKIWNDPLVRIRPSSLSYSARAPTARALI